jgi:hypothetical protein
MPKKSTRYGMPAELWDATCERARAFLIACARERRTTTYGELSAELVPARVPAYGFAMVALLDSVCLPAESAEGVVLAALVCTKATGMPGEGYFAHRERLWGPEERRAEWEADAERVYRAFAGE